MPWRNHFINFCITSITQDGPAYNVDIKKIVTQCLPLYEREIGDLQKLVVMVFMAMVQRTEKFASMDQDYMRSWCEGLLHQQSAGSNLFSLPAFSTIQKDLEERSKSAADNSTAANRKRTRQVDSKPEKRENTDDSQPQASPRDSQPSPPGDLTAQVAQSQPDPVAVQPDLVNEDQQRQYLLQLLQKNQNSQPDMQPNVPLQGLIKDRPWDRGPHVSTTAAAHAAAAALAAVMGGNGTNPMGGSGHNNGLLNGRSSSPQQIQPTPRSSSPSSNIPSRSSNSPRLREGSPSHRAPSASPTIGIMSASPAPGSPRSVAGLGSNGRRSANSEIGEIKGRPGHWVWAEDANAADRQRVRASCHQCKSNKGLDRLLFCTNKGDRPAGIKKCRKKFCEGCLFRSYSQSIDEVDPKIWLCPACKSKCTCAACQRKNKGVPALGGTGSNPALGAAPIPNGNDSSPEDEPREPERGRARERERDIEQFNNDRLDRRQPCPPFYPDGRGSPHQSPSRSLHSSSPSGRREEYTLLALQQALQVQTQQYSPNQHYSPTHQQRYSPRQHSPRSLPALSPSPRNPLNNFMGPSPRFQGISPSPRQLQQSPHPNGSPHAGSGSPHHSPRQLHQGQGSPYMEQSHSPRQYDHNHSPRQAHSHSQSPHPISSRDAYQRALQQQQHQQRYNQHFEQLQQLGAQELQRLSQSQRSQLAQVIASQQQRPQSSQGLDEQLDPTRLGRSHNQNLASQSQNLSNQNQIQNQSQSQSQGQQSFARSQQGQLQGQQGSQSQQHGQQTQASGSGLGWHRELQFASRIDDVYPIPVETAQAHHITFSTPADTLKIVDMQDDLAPWYACPFLPSLSLGDSFSISTPPTLSFSSAQIPTSGPASTFLLDDPFDAFNDATQANKRPLR